MPRRVAVVGAGMAGLATAWFLQERDVEVTVYERERIAAGASWGNAGWVSPGFVAPLPEPAVLRYGLRAVISPRSPVYLPLRADPDLLRFLVSFVRNSTPARWRRGMSSYVPLMHRVVVRMPVMRCRHFWIRRRNSSEMTSHVHDAPQRGEFSETNPAGWLRDNTKRRQT